jgi:crotonobetainyl-CoA:carnitine CoA-transferase CaiB-like acyl-CoA transferase
VIKLEPPGGDPLRHHSASGAAVGPGQGAALFGFLNTSKKSAVIDTDTDQGRRRLYELARRCDVLLHSFEPGPARPGWLAELPAQAPKLLRIALTSFGNDGPWAGRPATEFTLQALCGSTAFRGLPEREPLAAGGRLGEWIGGVYAANAALLGLREARATRRVPELDVSLFECMSVGLCFHEHLKASLSGDLESYMRERFGREIEVPSIEAAADGYVGFALFTAEMWASFLEMVERPDLKQDPELRFMLSRWPRREEVYAAIRPWLRAHRVDEIVAEATRRRIPVAPIGSGANIAEIEPFASSGALVPNPGQGFLQPRVPYRFSDREPRAFAPAPALAADNNAVEALLLEPPRPAPGDGAADPGRPLSGLRVIDFTQFIAGPTVTHLLALMGADVVKIESLQRPDGIRFASSQPPDKERWWEYSWVFHGLNANKRSITLDLQKPEGVELALRLVADADLLVENFAPGVMERFGLDYDRIAEIAPRAVYVRMPAFGLTGPWRSRVGLAQTMEQLTGMAHCTGYPDGPPIIPRGPCDAIAGLHAAFAALVALDERDRTGRGRQVECLMVETALNVAAEQIVEYAAYGHCVERDGNRDPIHAPQNVYACRGTERWLALSVVDEAQWQALVEWLGKPHWCQAPELASGPGRRAAQDHLDTQLAAVFAERELEPTVEELLAVGVPVAPVVASPRVPEHTQHVARGFYVPLAHPQAGTQPYPSLPFRVDGGGRPETPPPLLGQHNDEVLGGELGLDAARLARLREAHIIGEDPEGY